MKIRYLTAFLLVLAAIYSRSALGVLPPSDTPLPNLDKRTAVGLNSAVIARQDEAIASLRAKVPSAQYRRKPGLGTSVFVSASRGFLTGPNGAGKAVSENQLAVFPSTDLHRPVKAFLNEHSALFGFDASALNQALVSRDYVTSHNGLRTTVWQQTLNGISVLDAVLVGHVTAKGELVNVSSEFVPNVNAAANAGVGNAASAVANPAIDGAKAVSLAATHLGEQAIADDIQSLGQPEGLARRQKFEGARIKGDAYAELVWVPVSRDAMRLAWRTELTPAGRQELYAVFVDALTGEVLIRRSLTAYLKDATFNVYTSDSPSPFSPGHPTPLRTQPAVVQRKLVKMAPPLLNTIASPSGWIDDDDNETQGNNVDAHTDLNADNRPDLPRPQGNNNRVFDFPLDLTQAPRSYTNASVVQLFYWNNIIHDRFYEFGFTEEAGNFQLDNFGRGGAGNDPVQADAQDGGGTDNANFATPPDGRSGRMQMYVFTGPDPDRDGDLDAEVIIHEYTHGLSNRLVGNGIGIFELQPAGMGEGWSDFYALSLLGEEADDVDGTFATGGYLTFRLGGPPGGLEENYYFGIRRYPYSTDLKKNPLTFKDIDPSQADPHAGIPINPIIGGGPADEVHNMGEIWCVALWEARAALVKKLGFQEGNQMILQLVTDGMKLAPPNPTFLEARDAILQADEINSGGDNRNELWIAFAKRGMGASAKAPPSFTATGVIEAFDLPEDVFPTLPDGYLEVTVTPPNGAALFASVQEPIFVRVTDGGAVTNATISASINIQGANLTFRNDGVNPDKTRNNAVYSGNLDVPNINSLRLTLIVTAPGKEPSTNIVNYSIISLPTNDNFTNAVKVAATGGNFLSNNRFATMEPSEPTHAGVSLAAASLWWRFTSPITTNVLVDTAGSTFNSIVAVYTNSTLASLRQVAAADDIGTRRQAYVTFNAQAGVSYQIAVASAGESSTGTLRLNIQPGGSPDITPPIVRVTSPGSGLYTSTNRVVVTGSVEDPLPVRSGVDQLEIRVNPGLSEFSNQSLAGSFNFGAESSSIIASTNWTRVVALQEGLNIIQVSAKDVAGNKSDVVSIQVTFRPLDPINDIFANAIVLTNVTGVSSVNTLNATKEVGEPNHAGNLGGRSAWWSFRAPADGVLFLSTTNSSFDTLMGLYVGDRVNTLTAVTSNDDALEGVSFSKINQAVRANTTYRIAVDGFGGDGGVAFLEYSFRPSVIYRVTITSSVGGKVTPETGDFEANSTLVLTATPAANYEFDSWEGSVTSTQNPISIIVTANMNVTARFRPIAFTDGFESGNLSGLSWTSGGNAPWIVQGQTVAFGNFAARSGTIGNLQTSSLMLTTKLRAGRGAFDFKVSSEAGWDFLEFYLDGRRLARWSGEIDWQRFDFEVTEGEHRMEWRYAKDANNSVGMDAAFLDNFDLPLLPPVDETTPAQLRVLNVTGTSVEIRVQGQANQRYAVEVSADLKEWSVVTTQVAVGGSFQFTDQVPRNTAARFYRAVTQ
jgi:hypothetical protein